MKCPKCKVMLNAASTKQGVIIDCCPQCKGLWLAKDKIYSFSQKPQWIHKILKKGLGKPHPSERLCPQCASVKMVEGSFIKDDLLIDICPSCNGIWFDEGELSQGLELGRKKFEIVLDIDFEEGDSTPGANLEKNTLQASSPIDAIKNPQPFEVSEVTKFSEYKVPIENCYTSYVNYRGLIKYTIISLLIILFMGLSARMLVKIIIAIATAFADTDDGYYFWYYVGLILMAFLGGYLVALLLKFSARTSTTLHRGITFITGLVSVLLIYGISHYNFVSYSLSDISYGIYYFYVQYVISSFWQLLVLGIFLLMALLLADSDIREIRFCSSCKQIMQDDVLKKYPLYNIPLVFASLKEGVYEALPKINTSYIVEEKMRGELNISYCPQCHNSYADFNVTWLSSPASGDSGPSYTTTPIYSMYLGRELGKRMLHVFQRVR